jgi:hypothetical protein
MLVQANASESKKDIKTRQHLMERSYARSTRYGFKRGRWRRFRRVQIQEYRTATIQNMMVLLRHIKEPEPALVIIQAKPGHQRACLKLQDLFVSFKEVITCGMNRFLARKCYGWTA